MRKAKVLFTSLLMLLPLTAGCKKTDSATSQKTSDPASVVSVSKDSPTSNGSLTSTESVTSNGSVTSTESVSVGKATPKIAYADGFRVKQAYTGKPIVVDTTGITVTGNAGDLVIEFLQETDGVVTYTTAAPKAVGTYRARAVLLETETTNAVQGETFDVEITKAEIRLLDDIYFKDKALAHTYQLSAADGIVNNENVFLEIQPIPDEIRSLVKTFNLTEGEPDTDQAEVKTILYGIDAANYRLADGNAEYFVDYDAATSRVTKAEWTTMPTLDKEGKLHITGNGYDATATFAKLSSVDYHVEHIVEETTGEEYDEYSLDSSMFTKMTFANAEYMLSGDELDALGLLSFERTFTVMTKYSDGVKAHVEDVLKMASGKYSGYTVLEVVVEYGKIKRGDVLHMNDDTDVTVVEVGNARNVIDTGDRTYKKVSIMTKDVVKNDDGEHPVVKRGDVLLGAKHYETKVAEIDVSGYFYTKNQGGKQTPLTVKDKPEVYANGTTVPASLVRLDSEMVLPGSAFTGTFDLLTETFFHEGQYVEFRDRGPIIGYVRVEALHERVVTE